MDDKQRILFESLNENVTLNEMQAYIKNIISIRGFSEQKVQDTMLLLFEETRKEWISGRVCLFPLRTATA